MTEAIGLRKFLKLKVGPELKGIQRLFDFTPFLIDAQHPCACTLHDTSLAQNSLHRWLLTYTRQF